MESSDKKRLVVYFHRYPIEYEIEQYAGLPSLIAELKKKYDFTYFSMKNSVQADKPEIRKGIKVVEIPIGVNRISAFDKWFKTLLYYLYLPFSLAKLKNLNPDFIICKETMPFVPTLVGMLGIPMIVDISDWWWSILFGKYKIGKKIAKVIERFEVATWKRLKIVNIAHTNAEAELVGKKGMPRSRIFVVNAPAYEGVYAPAKASDIRKKLFEKDDWVGAMHGIIHPSKGYDQVLEWWKKLVQVHNNWKLMIIGGSSGENWCKNKIRELGLEKNVIMAGWLPTQKDVNRYLNASDFLLVTRRNTEENSGIIPSTLYHSMAVGKPVVATGLPGFKEIVSHEINGYIFEPDNFESFGNVLEKIYSNPKVAKKVGAAGIKRGKECFDPHVAARKWVNVVDGALAK